MPIQVTCPGCHAGYNVPDAYAGKQIRCKRCQSTVPVGAAPAAARAAAPAPAAAAASTIQTSCPSCHAVYKLPETMLGKSARCKKCQTSFVIGAAPKPAEELVAILVGPPPAAVPPPRAVQPGPPPVPAAAITMHPAMAPTLHGGPPPVAHQAAGAPDGSPLQQFVHESTRQRPGPVAF